LAVSIVVVHVNVVQRAIVSAYAPTWLHYPLAVGVVLPLRMAVACTDGTADVNWFACMAPSLLIRLPRVRAVWDFLDTSLGLLPK
jgi:hypothetical protein